ncbi:MAG: stage II sporulation protein E [Anaerolineales bacterium]|nr:serine/threonine-protein phosphatase [Anaerolineae bacterium]PWB53082.1 MAG: stage II sporulation protein E [Anaerolineales bacterium]
MEIKLAVAKINKYATSESGDSVEVVERPNGGISVVMADGQSSGKGAKQVSSLVVRKVIFLLSEGVRDGAAARAASDYLFTERKGKVSATLNIVSIDLQTVTMVITRNNPLPVFIASNEEICAFDDECNPIGIYRDTRPLINELPLEPGLTVVLFTDGLIYAGSRSGESLNIKEFLESHIEEQPNPQELADQLLSDAMQLDRGRPVDDISVVVIQVTGQHVDGVRRMTVQLPLQT